MTKPPTQSTSLGWLLQAEEWHGRKRPIFTILDTVTAAMDAVVPGISSIHAFTNTLVGAGQHSTFEQTAKTVNASLPSTAKIADATLAKTPRGDARDKYVGRSFQEHSRQK